MAHFRLIFFTAAWCDPAIPMQKIFDETLHDLIRLRPKLDVEGFAVDIDTEEENHLVGAPELVSDKVLESVDFVPLLVLGTYAGGEFEEIERWVGQLPKRLLREQLLSALDASATK